MKKIKGEALKWILKNKEWLSNTRGVIQLGIGCEMYEFPQWTKRGFNQIYCDPVKRYYESLSRKIRKCKKTAIEMKTFKVAISDFCGKSQFNILHKVRPPHKVKKDGVTTRELPDSSTLLTMSDRRPHKLGGFAVKEQEEVDVLTLDELIKINGIDLSKYNMLYMDIEGSEASAVQGGLETIKHMDFIYAEVALVEIFKETVTYDHFVPMMDELGFRLLHSHSVGVRLEKICHDVFFARK